MGNFGVAKLYGKRLRELTRVDIERVVTEQMPEGSEFELKGELPAKKGDDPWLTKGDRIGDYARNELLAEVVAFANAYGGTLLVGVTEAHTKPPRAASIRPLPRCAELAERLRLAARDLVDPQIPLLEVEGVPTANDGSGVVIFHVPRSRMAPHWHVPTRECFVRRADRTERLTMREIQDLSLQVERGIARVDRQFDRRQSEFAHMAETFSQGHHCYGLRATAVPFDIIAVDRVHGVDEVRPPLIVLHATINGNGPYPLFFPVHQAEWRPILRGTRGVSNAGSDLILHREILTTGSVEYTAFKRKENDKPFRLYPQWLMGIVCNTLCAVEKFRRFADAPDVEYLLEFEISLIGRDLRVERYGRDWFAESGIASISDDGAIFPRYSIGTSGTFVEIARLLERDFWHYVGRDWGQQGLTVDFAEAFQQIGLPTPS